MNAKLSSIVARLALGLVALAFAAHAVEARPPVRDQVFRGARLKSHARATVAVLPAVSVTGNHAAERLVEENWVRLYGGSEMRWLPASIVRAHLEGAPGGEAFARDVAGQIWQTGQVNPEAAGRLARMFGADALLSLRIDRWEIVNGWRAIVEMTAVLTDEDGTPLWTISGSAGHGAAPSGADLGVQEGDAHQYRWALYTLMARWAWSLPSSPFEPGPEREAPRLLAGHPAE